MIARSVRVLLTLFPLVVVACGAASKGPVPEAPSNAGGSGHANPTDSPNGPPIPKMSGNIRNFEKSKENLKVDKVGSKDGELEPDGVADMVYEVDIEGPADGVFVISTDDRGNPNGELAADTLVGKEPLPSEVVGLGAFGKHTAGLGIFEKGKLLNASDGHLPALSPGPHALVVHLSTKDAPKAGALRVFVRFTDGSLAKSATDAPVGSR